MGKTGFWYISAAIELKLLVFVWIIEIKKIKKNPAGESMFFNRPGVAGAVLQTPFWLIHSLTNSSFSSKYSRHLHSQTVWARDLEFWENVHLPWCVTCHISHVTGHMLCFTCCVSHIACHIKIKKIKLKKKRKKVVELVSGGSVINGAYLV